MRDKSKPQHKPTSILLGELVESHGEERLSLGHLLDALGERGFGLLCIVMALPVCVPIPLPLGIIFGPALLILGLQMMAGLPKPWLPRILREKSMSIDSWKKLVKASMKLLKPIERVCKPRGNGLISRPMERVTGLMTVLCALALIIPIIGNNFPVGISVVIMSIAWIERDGWILVAGMVSAVLSVIYSAAILWVGYEALMWILGKMFGWA